MSTVFGTGSSQIKLSANVTITLTMIIVFMNNKYLRMIVTCCMKELELRMY